MQTYDYAQQIPDDLLASCAVLPPVRSVLMCPPKFFDVIDVKNPHMAAHVGQVDTATAHAQWQALVDTFIRCGVEVETITPVAGCEDMVFCANQTFVGPDATGRPTCITSNMTHESRRLEVPAFQRWFAKHGYTIQHMKHGVQFEGGGDAVWHPGRRLVWGGVGPRTQPAAYESLARLLGVPVIRLLLQHESFYHLDTCFCALDEHTVLIHVPSLAPDSVAMIRRVFAHVIECDDHEASHGMACNATALHSRNVIIQRGNPNTVAALTTRGFTVHEVDTGEFLKSGGSVYCMKMFLF